MNFVPSSFLPTQAQHLLGHRLSQLSDQVLTIWRDCKVAEIASCRFFLIRSDCFQYQEIAKKFTSHPFFPGFVSSQLRKTVAKRITLNWLIQRDNETRNLKTNDGQIQRRKRIYSSFLFKKTRHFWTILLVHSKSQI